MTSENRPHNKQLIMTSENMSIARGALLLANFAWFGAGFVQFVFRARLAFTRGIRRRPGESVPTHVDHAADIFRYLGAMGGSLSLSTLPKIINLFFSRHHSHNEGLSYLFWLWGAAHASQAITTMTIVAPSGRWRWEGMGLGMITYIDVSLWAANWAMWYFGK